MSQKKIRNIGIFPCIPIIGDYNLTLFFLSYNHTEWFQRFHGGYFLMDGTHISITEGVLLVF